SCFDDANRLKEEKLLFIAGGVGITPFLSMLGALRKRNVNADIVFLFSARGEEIILAKQFQDAGIETRVFDTDQSGKAESDVFRRRIGYEDVANISAL